MSTDWDYPTSGGTYIRDDATGTLRKLESELPVDPAPPATEPDPVLEAGTDPAAAALAQPAPKSRKGTV